MSEQHDPRATFFSSVGGAHLAGLARELTARGVATRVVTRFSAARWRELVGQSRFRELDARLRAFVTYPLRALATAALVAGLVVATVVMWFLFQHFERERQRAEREAAAAATVSELRLLPAHGRSLSATKLMRGGPPGLLPGAARRTIA